MTPIHLDVDFIGGGRPLTKEDEKAISDFIQARKLMKGKEKARLSSRGKTYVFLTIWNLLLIGSAQGNRNLAS
jgi:hypothetical protein